MVLDFNQAPATHGQAHKVVLPPALPHDIIERFRQEIEGHGLRPDDIFVDGEIHRCGTEGKESGKDGAYLLHLDHPASGWWENHRTGESSKWSGVSDHQMTAEDRQALRARIDQDKQRRQAERERYTSEAREKAIALWGSYSPASEGNPYLAAKGVLPAGDIRADGDTLVVPVLGHDAQAQSLQFIQADGDKRFLKDGQVSGGYFPILGGPGSLYVCEGVATGLSIHQATGETVICAFNASNLQAVAKLARERQPDREIIIAGDNDRKTELKNGKNPGRASAEKAARAVGGKVVLPLFPEDRTDLSDFNDLHELKGLEAVRERLGQAHGGQGEGFLTSLDLDACKVGRLLDTPPEPLEWTFKESMLTNSVGLIVGPPGAGKSTFLIELAISVASGVPLFGEHLIPDRPGKVLALFCEDDQRVLHHRTHRLARQLEKRAESLPLERSVIGERIYFISGVGQDVRLVAEMTGQAPEPSAAYDDLLSLAKGLEGLALIILDPYSRTSGVSENDNPLNTFVVSLLERLALETGASVVCVHHVGKRAGYVKGAFDLDEAMHPDMLRGATAITGAIRWQMNLFPLPEKAAKEEIGDPGAEWGQYLAAKVSKKNYGPPETLFFLKREYGGLLVPARAAVKVEHDETDKRLERWVLRKVREAEEKGMGLTKYKMGSFSDEWKVLGGSRVKIDDAVERLLYREKLFIDKRKNGSGKMTKYLCVSEPSEPERSEQSELKLPV